MSAILSVRVDLLDANTEQHNLVVAAHIMCHKCFSFAFANGLLAMSPIDVGFSSLTEFSSPRRLFVGIKGYWVLVMGFLLSFFEKYLKMLTICFGYVWGLACVLLSPGLFVLVKDNENTFMVVFLGMVSLWVAVVETLC